VLSDPKPDDTGRSEDGEAKLLFCCAVFLANGLAGDAAPLDSDIGDDEEMLLFCCVVFLANGLAGDAALDSDIEAEAEPHPESGN
jgi:hypothetical protein